mgnify:CR=1 FL=1
MLNKVKLYIDNNNICAVGAPILVACSGGVDSMVLIDVLLKLHHTIAIAHCNFQLRGEESTADERFLQDFALKANIPFFSIKFDTKKFKANNAVSTQMAARALRYDWFEKIRKENGFHSIATAHHLDDQLETIILNITKGTGIAGLTGMQPKNGHIIRPFLSCSKQEIATYAETNLIPFREDSSNASDDYQRNLIRHQIVPTLQKINTALYASIKVFVDRMNDYEVLTEAQLSIIKKKCFTEKKGIIEIKTGYIKAHKAGHTVLFHLLKTYGFNSIQAADIFNGLETQSSGKQFFSASHRVIIDRRSLFIVPIESEHENYLLFDKIPNKISFNKYKIQCSIVPIAELNMKTSTRYAYLDADKLKYPLLMRFAKEGDYFYPYGMHKPKTTEKVGKKKVSKYFKDEKFTLLEKEQTPILFSAEKLAWIVGHRIDDRLKVTDKTKNVLKMVIVAH